MHFFCRSRSFILACSVVLIQTAVAADEADDAVANKGGMPAVVAPVVDDVMWQDPYLPVPKWLPKFSKTLVPIWLEALARPEAETRRVAAGTFAIAASRSMPDLEPAVEPLRSILTNDDDPVVRRAAAAALVAMDAQQASGELANAAANDGLLMAIIAEPALAQWGDAAAQEVWLSRLQDPRCEPALLRLATESLAIAGTSKAVEPLLASVVDDTRPFAVRVTAARACGSLQATGLLDTASDLATRRLRPAHTGPLLAVLLLAKHDDPGTVKLLTSLASASEPTVATAALDRLRQIDNELALPLARPAITSPDAGLRRVAAEILITRGDAAAVTSLCPLLDDRNPGIRGMVAGALILFAADEDLEPAVLEGSTAVLAADGWRGLEQAALVLGTLDHEPAADRLLQVLNDPRPEAAVAAAWALRKLSVDATLEPLLRFAEAGHARMAGEGAASYVGLQLSQIFQFFGEVRYEPGEPLMRKFVPKSTLLPDTRGAACWALGYLKQENPDEQLAETFAGRLADVGSPNPENDLVRAMTALGLGRMKSESQLSTLRTFGDQHGPIDHVGLSCLWAIEQITGEPMETIETLTFGVSGWFLQPALR